MLTLCPELIMSLMYTAVMYYYFFFKHLNLYTNVQSKFFVLLHQC